MPIRHPKEPYFFQDGVSTQMFYYMHQLSLEQYNEEWKQDLEFEIWGSHVGDNTTFVGNPVFDNLMSLHPVASGWFHRPSGLGGQEECQFLLTSDWEQVYASGN